MRTLLLKKVCKGPDCCYKMHTKNKERNSDAANCRTRVYRLNVSKTVLKYYSKLRDVVSIVLLVQYLNNNLITVTLYSVFIGLRVMNNLTEECGSYLVNGYNNSNLDVIQPLNYWLGYYLGILWNIQLSNSNTIVVCCVCTHATIYHSSKHFINEKIRSSVIAHCNYIVCMTTYLLRQMSIPQLPCHLQQSDSDSSHFICSFFFLLTHPVCIFQWLWYKDIEIYNGPYCQLYDWTMYRVYFENDYNFSIYRGKLWYKIEIKTKNYRKSIDNMILFLLRYPFSLFPTTNLCQSAICLRGAFITSFHDSIMIENTKLNTHIM
ncbi:hypothetical protein AGLY_005523 [Aphis glycines]|uniref:Uncharacterized protein n=1 Tax=Aphis glycines TaxID=307491 RepID=A0A6G0TUD5_APHGL|nr:hypothetical protein AGLY_005523 [Aphis glycines]